MVAGNATVQAKAFSSSKAYGDGSWKRACTSTIIWVSWIWSNGSSTLEADGVGAGDNCGDLAAFDDEALVDEVEYTSSPTHQEHTPIIRQSLTTGKAATPPTKLNTQRIPPSHKFTTARGRLSRQIETRQTASQRSA
jgi:hypothetical protein